MNQKSKPSIFILMMNDTPVAASEDEEKLNEYKKIKVTEANLKHWEGGLYLDKNGYHVYFPIKVVDLL